MLKYPLLDGTPNLLRTMERVTGTVHKIVPVPWNGNENGERHVLER